MTDTIFLDKETKLEVCIIDFYYTECVLIVRHSASNCQEIIALAGRTQTTTKNSTTCPLKHNVLSLA